MMKKMLLTVAAVCGLSGYALASDLPVYQPAEPLSADTLPTYRLTATEASAVLPTLTPALKFHKAATGDLPTLDNDTLPTVEPAPTR